MINNNIGLKKLVQWDLKDEDSHSCQNCKFQLNQKEECWNLNMDVYQINAHQIQIFISSKGEESLKVV